MWMPTSTPATHLLVSLAQGLPLLAQLLGEPNDGLVRALGALGGATLRQELEEGRGGLLWLGRVAQSRAASLASSLLLRRHVCVVALNILRREVGLPLGEVLLVLDLGLGSEILEGLRAWKISQLNVQPEPAPSTTHLLLGITECLPLRANRLDDSRCLDAVLVRGLAYDVVLGQLADRGELVEYVEEECRATRWLGLVGERN